MTNYDEEILGVKNTDDIKGIFYDQIRKITPRV